MINKKEMLQEIEDYFSNISKEELLNDLKETNSLDLLECILQDNKSVDFSMYDEFELVINEDLISLKANSLESIPNFSKLEKGFSSKASKIINSGNLACHTLNSNILIGA